MWGNSFRSMCLLIALLVTSNMTAQQLTESVQKAKKIIKANEKSLEKADQLLLVTTDAETKTEAVFYAFEKTNQVWSLVHGPIKAVVGRKGMATPGSKIEGDGKSPTGLFALGQLFSYEKTIQSTLPFIQTGTDDKWIDDSESPDYNKYVRGKTNAKSYENLLLKSID